MAESKVVRDSETLALELMINLGNIVKAGEKADALVRRAKDLPSLVADVGLTQAMAFYASKAELYKKDERGRDKVEDFARLVNYLATGTSTGEEPDRLRKSLQGDLEGEGKGYLTMFAVTVALLKKVLKDLGVRYSECEDIARPERLAGCLLKLKGESEKLVYIEKVVLEALVTIKRLAEALYE